MRLKLNWFSPLPPLRTDIGHYTARFLPELSKLADVTLWTTQPEWDVALERLAPVRRWIPAVTTWRDLNRADLNCYNIGNNPAFHGEITDLARTVPGLVVLHDSRLQHFIHAYLPLHDYRALMFDLYGREGLEAVEAISEHRLSLSDAAVRFPLTPYATKNALGIVMHNRAERDLLATEVDAPVFDLPLPYEAGPSPTPPQRSGPVRLILFGHLGVNRRIDKIFDALAGLSDKQDFRLDVYGHIWDQALVEQWIAERSLGDIVHLHGFVEDAALDRAIGDAELAINLRWPTMGEASGSQLRAWNAGRAGLVTRAGWYASLPSDGAFFVDLDREVDDIRRHLISLRTDPEPYWRSGASGRDILERRHGSAGYAARLVDHISVLLAGDAGIGKMVGASLGNCLAQWPHDLTDALDWSAFVGRLAPARS